MIINPPILTRPPLPPLCTFHCAVVIPSSHSAPQRLRARLRHFALFILHSSFGIQHSAFIAHRSSFIVTALGAALRWFFGQLGGNWGRFGRRFGGALGAVFHPSGSVATNVTSFGKTTYVRRPPRRTLTNIFCFFHTFPHRPNPGPVALPSHPSPPRHRRPNHSGRPHPGDTLLTSEIARSLSLPDRYLYGVSSRKLSE